MLFVSLPLCYRSTFSVWKKNQTNMRTSTHHVRVQSFEMCLCVCVWDACVRARAPVHVCVSSFLSFLTWLREKDVSLAKRKWLWLWIAGIAVIVQTQHTQRPFRPSPSHSLSTVWLCWQTRKWRLNTVRKLCKDRQWQIFSTPQLLRWECIKGG